MGAGDSVTDLYVTRCRFVDTDNGVGIKTWAMSSKPGAISCVAFEHIEMVNVDNPIIIDQEYCPGGGCNTQESSQVQISDVKFNDINQRHFHYKGSSGLKCSRSRPCQNIELNDIDLTYRGPGGPAVSVCYNVKGRAYGLQNPPLQLVTPRVAAYDVAEDDNVEHRAYGRQNPFVNLEDDNVQGGPYGLQNPCLNLEDDYIEGRGHGLEDPSLN